MFFVLLRVLRGPLPRQRSVRFFFATDETFFRDVCSTLSGPRKDALEGVTAGVEVGAGNR